MELRLEPRKLDSSIWDVELESGATISFTAEQGDEFRGRWNLAGPS